MQSLSKYNKRIKYLLCAIYLFSKYAWVVPMKDKKGTSLVNAFKKIISKRKPNKIWADQGSEFYNSTFKVFLRINNIEMHSTYKEGKSVVAEFFIEYNVNLDKKDPKFKVGDNVRMSKYKIIFAKGYTPNWSEEVFVISKIKNTVPWNYIVSDLNGEEITGSFYEKELQ